MSSEFGWRQVAGRVAEVLWPRRCAVCGRPVDRPSRHLCSECLMRLPFLPAKGVCALCSRPVEGYAGDFVCEDCRRRPPAFDRVASALRYEGEVPRLVQDYKFRERHYLVADFVDFLAAAAEAHLVVPQVDFLLPMPLAWQRRLDRGFNQCEALAEALSRRFDRRVLKRQLRRVGNPKQQATLPREERLENAAGTFEVCDPDGWLKGRTLLVVEDVITTGATLNAAAAALKAAGARRVWALTLARAE